ncbi:unnamed protein product [Ectocarpus sp. 12 AP-2014]
MSRSRADFESEEFNEESPLSKKPRLSSGTGDDAFEGLTSYGNGNGGGSTFAINDDDDDDALDEGGAAAADAASPDGVGSVGGDGGGAAVCKNKKKPWKVHTSAGGGKMHDANLYRHYRPDFRELAREFPETFGPHVRDDPDTGRATIDWADPAAMRELTRVMLRHDFGLREWDAPLDRLCPPVANRLNYVCWLSDLMKLSPPSVSAGRHSSSPEDASGEEGGGGGMNLAQRNLLLYGTTRGVEEDGGEGMAVCDDDGDVGDSDQTTGGPKKPSRRGVDVGTGASCIYPLLGARVAGWSFLATEIDPVSADWAEKNVRSNDLQEQIEVRLVHSPADGGDDEASPGPLLAALREEDGDFDFSMTNPPFFESADEAGQNPDTATGDMAAAGEVACHGGEVAFVTTIIRDSLRLRERVRWYTSMVGKKANAKKLLRVLRESGVKNTRTTEFFQGRTVRWGLAWSFTSEGMVGGKVPDDPNVKVLSKKKAADRTQHNLRSFSAPLRPSSPADTPIRGNPGKAADEIGGRSGGADHPVVKITVPANLPKDADDVVARLKSSMMAFKQADVKVRASNEDSSTSTVADGAHRFWCEARLRSAAAGGAAAAAPAEEATTTTAAIAATPLLFAFELEVHCAAEWAGTAAARAAVQVWARFQEGGDRGAFHRLWETLQMDVLRQNRRWRREMTREAAGGR